MKGRGGVAGDRWRGSGSQEGLVYRQEAQHLNVNGNEPEGKGNLGAGERWGDCWGSAGRAGE